MMRGIWGASSSGMGGRVALYSGYISSRKVGPGPSIATARKSGLSCVKILCSIDVNPKTAWVGSPVTGLFMPLRMA